MVTVTIFKHQDQYKGFVFDGHAGFAKKGKDIVCAAISILVINTYNSIEQFTDDGFSGAASPDGGHIEMTFTDENSSELTLLLNSMLLGLKEIEKKYGSKYIKLQFKEV